MNRSIVQILVLASLAAAVVVGRVDRAEGASVGDLDEGILPPRIERQPTVAMPSEIARLPLRDPRARFLVRVDLDGSVADYVCIEASRPEFLPGAIKEIERARFRPASQNGVPIVADTTVTVQFTIPSGPLSISHMGMVHPDAIPYELNPALRDLPMYTVSSPGDLDQPLTVAERAEPFVPVTESGERVYGRTVVSAYVDHEGRTRMIRMYRSSGLEPVDAAAMQSLAGWRFAPPTRDGRPTTVRIRVPFVFSPTEP